jgi:hypothetical protein
MALEQKRIWEIVRAAKSQELDIPEFQRPFVWDAEQVRLLVESLYKNYPVGTFLVWDCSQYMESKTAQGSGSVLWIVDGQQRTTALALAFAEKPYWWENTKDWNDKVHRYDVLVKIVVGERDRVEFALPNKEKEADPAWVSIREIITKSKVEDLSPIAMRLAERAFETKEEAMSQFVKVHANVQAIWQIRDQEIPIVKINHEAEDVAEIFNRLNSEGTRVKEADTILAIAAVRNSGWVREEYLPFQESLEDRGWPFEAGVLIRTMTGIEEGRARLKQVEKDFWSPPRFVSVWKKAKDAIVEAIEYLVDRGISNTELISSKNTLIPLFVAHHRWKNDPRYKFDKLLKWFLLAYRDGRYSGAATTYLDEDIQALFKASDFEKSLEAMYRPLKVSASVSASELLDRFDRGTGRQFYRLMIFLLLKQNNAIDWVSSHKIGFDSKNALSSDFRPNWHHIFPKSILKNHGKDEDSIHYYGNITILNEKTNVTKLQSKTPTKYIREFNIEREQLAAHLIPLDYANATELPDEEFVKKWSVDHYDDFVMDRTIILARKITEYMSKLD